MKVLLFLSRFELNKEKVKEKINLVGKKIIFTEVKEGFEVEADVLDLEKLMLLQEIERGVILKTAWKELNFSQLKKDALELMNSLKKTYKIHVKFHDKIPISASSLYKHINPYLKHEGFQPSEESWESLLYLEIKKENNKRMYRFGVSERSLWEKANPTSVTMNFTIILENPSLKEEVSDFLRLCWIFKLPLVIVTKNKEFGKLLKKAKEETKGIEYEKFRLTVTEKIPTGLNVGFSKHALKNEKDLKEFFIKSEKINLIFGDDKFGLTQETRDSLHECFRLTPEVKKPLRASHALSYILGFYTAEQI